MQCVLDDVRLRGVQVSTSEGLLAYCNEALGAEEGARDNTCQGSKTISLTLEPKRYVLDPYIPRLPV
jgi:hypothetical protein